MYSEKELTEISMYIIDNMYILSNNTWWHCVDRLYRIYSQLFLCVLSTFTWFKSLFFKAIKTTKNYWDGDKKKSKTFEYYLNLRKMVSSKRLSQRGPGNCLVIYGGARTFNPFTERKCLGEVSLICILWPVSLPTIKHCTVRLIWRLISRQS
jgi:hypothetical protein